MPVPETQAARWCRCSARETPGRQSIQRRGRWRNTSRMIAAYHFQASHRRRRSGGSESIRRQLACGRYSLSSGLFSRLYEPGEEPRAAEGAAVAAGGSDRCLVEWVAVGEEADLVAARAAEDLAASAVAAAEAAGRPEAGRV